jgi:hypothetical protein
MWPPILPVAGRRQTTLSVAAVSPSMVDAPRITRRSYSGTEPVK